MRSFCFLSYVNTNGEPFFLTCEPSPLAKNRHVLLPPPKEYFNPIRRGVRSEPLFYFDRQEWPYLLVYNFLNLPK